MSAGIAPSSQADVAYEAVRDLIISLEIPPGAPIVEAELTARVGVGRTPLREALNRLESERLVNIFPRRGTFAADINLPDLALITDLRVELEGHAAAKAAERATNPERVALSQLTRSLGTRDPSGEMAADTRIHRAIYGATHNRFLVDTATQYHNLSMRIWHLFMDRLSDLSDHVAQHRQLIDHIVAGDADRARRAAVDHVRGFENAVRSLL